MFKVLKAILNIRKLYSRLTRFFSCYKKYVRATYQIHLLGKGISVMVANFQIAFLANIKSTVRNRQSFEQRKEIWDSVKWSVVLKAQYYQIKILYYEMNFLNYLKELRNHIGKLFLCPPQK